MARGDRLDEMIRNYRERDLPGQLARIEALLVELEKDPRHMSAAPDLYHEFHRLSGTAGSYGYLRVTELAAELEDRLIPHLTHPTPLSAADLKWLKKGYAALRRAAAKPDAPE